MIRLGDPGPRHVPVDRSSDRTVALGAVALAVAFLCVAAAAALLPVDAFSDDWLPLHLAMAGGASTAIAGVMPFFSAAFAAAPPNDARIRWTSVGLVAGGAGALTVGATISAMSVAVTGGIAFATGAILVAIATIRPRRQGLGATGGLVTRGYVTALMIVAVGASLATLYLAGWPPVVESWAQLRPAHAWLNLVGFVSVVVATTLLHFFPTVIGSRMSRSPAAFVTVAALAVGAITVALGFAIASDSLARFGAMSIVVGVGALLAYAVHAWRDRSTWTQDRGWHRFATWGLVSGIGWFTAGMAISAGRILVEGPTPSSASIEALIGPLVVGWVGLTILASATHLLPAIGPGDSKAHARQRTLLGSWAAARLASANAGVLALTVGELVDSEDTVMLGMIGITFALGSTVVLLAGAVMVGLRVPAGPPDER